MALTYAQKLAFSETLAQFIRDNEVDLRKVGFDTAKKLATLERFIRSAIDLDVVQETIKSELVKATDEAVTALDDCYHEASSMTDAMVGLLGKKTPLSKRLRKLRDQMTLVAQRGKRPQVVEV